MKKIFIFVIICSLIALIGCTKTKILHCDYCNKEVTVNDSSNMQEDWIIYCKECNEKLFGDDPLLGGK